MEDERRVRYEQFLKSVEESVGLPIPAIQDMAPDEMMRYGENRRAMMQQEQSLHFRARVWLKRTFGFSLPKRK